MKIWWARSSLVCENENQRECQLLEMEICQVAIGRLIFRPMTLSISQP